VIHEEPRPRRRRTDALRGRRAAYLLPSLFTLGNMFFGFFAIISAERNPERVRFATLLIAVAALLDSVDGRLARMTGTESEFGKEYDSLADVLTFGAAPALLTYFWGLKDFHPDAWLFCFFFTVCTATRLARFNVQHKVADSRYFVGLPAPAGAAMICSLLYFAPDAEWRTWVQVLVAIALLLVGMLMVSTFRYNSFKKFDLRQRLSYRILVPLTAIVLVCYYMPYALALILATAFTLSGPATWLYGQLRGSRGGAPASPGGRPPAEPAEPLSPITPPSSAREDLPLGRDLPVQPIHPRDLPR
jgi:CDP-diacylglycerol--serine O-phosphatidyltransferase